MELQWSDPSIHALSMGQVVNILGSLVHTVSVTATQF